MRKSLTKSLTIGLVLIAVTVLNIVLWSQEASAQSAPDVYYNTFEYSDMRPSITFNGTYWKPIGATGPYWGAVPLGASEQPNQAAGVYTASANLGTDGAHPPVYVNDSNICRGQWCLRVDMSTAYGDRLYYLTLGNTLPNQTTNHLFYRQYQRWPTGYQMASGKINYMRDYNGSTVILKHQCPDQTKPCSTSTLQIEVGNPSANYNCNQGHSCDLTGDNQWHEIETELDPNGGSANAATIRVWLDGVLVMEYCSTCTSKATIYTPLNPGGIAFGEYTTPASGDRGPALNQSFWLDDLAVSRQRIGSVSGTSGTATSPPSGPTNLSLR